jgi:hypothetical protein
MELAIPQMRAKTAKLLSIRRRWSIMETNTGYPHNYPHKLKSILEAPEHLIGTDSKPGNPMML